MYYEHSAFRRLARQRSAAGTYLLIESLVNSRLHSRQTLDQLRSFAQSNIFTIIGEWSNAITDCAKWLNGRGIGARWDGTWQPGQQTFGSCNGFSGNMSTFSASYKTFLRQSVLHCIFVPVLQLTYHSGTGSRKSLSEKLYRDGCFGRGRCVLKSQPASRL